MTTCHSCGTEINPIRPCHRLCPSGQADLQTGRRSHRQPGIYGWTADELLTFAAAILLLALSGSNCVATTN